MVGAIMSAAAARRKRSPLLGKAGLCDYCRSGTTSMGAQRMSDTAAREYENRGASKDAIQAQYDTGNAFFERLLGPTMGYSAGLWVEPAKRDSYDDAQVRKLDWHVDWSGADKANRVLDVGVGWGSFVGHLAARNPDALVTGLTVSDAQAGYLAERFGERVRVAPVAWQNFSSNETYDGIVNIEAIEHFARFDTRGPERVRAYREFFEFCAGRLAPGGRLSLQMTCWLNVDEDLETGYQAEFVQNFFPETCLPRIPQIVAASDGLFHVVRLESNPRDYAYTQREWIRRLRAMAAERAFDAELLTRHIEYYENNINGYLVGVLTLVRMALERRGPHVGWNMAKSVKMAR
jgi:cyclopropane-fatty-acyl-phospholipid synthase